MRYLSFSVLPLLFIGCATPNHTLTEQSITINTATVEYSKKFQNQTITYPHTNCVQNAITIKSDELSVEKIVTKPGCQWSGSSVGFYKDFLSKNFTNLKLLDRYSKDTVEIYQYDSEGKVFYFISYYDGKGDIFILDYVGNMATTLSQNKLKTIEKSNQIKTRLSKSLITNTPFGSYFQSTKDNAEEVLVP